MSATSYDLLQVVQIAGFRAGNLKERITTVENPNPEMFNFVECVNDVLQKMSRVRPLPSGNGEIVITTLDDYDTGTISSTTQGSTTIQATGADFTDLDNPQGMALATNNRNDIYRIAFVQSQLILDLTEPWASEALSSSNAPGYVIAQDRYDLPDDFSDFVSVTLEGETSRTLDIIRPSEIDQQRYDMSTKPMTLGTPLRCSMFHTSDDGKRQITLEPFPDSIFRVRVKYVKTYRRLGHNKDVIPIYDRNIFTLINGVAALWKFITADNDAGKTDWMLWNREELPAYAAFDRETTDEVPHMTPDDVMRTVRPSSLIS